MNAKQIGALLLLSALWGGSFLFIRIAAPVLGPVRLIELRVLIAVLLAVVALALLCTAVAYLLYFWLIEHAGPTRALTVTFLAPVFGVLWGTVLLSEPLSLSTFIGFGIILMGTGFVTGVRLRKEPTIPTVEQTQRDDTETALTP